MSFVRKSFVYSKTTDSCENAKLSAGSVCLFNKAHGATWSITATRGGDETSHLELMSASYTVLRECEGTAVFMNQKQCTVQGSLTLFSKWTKGFNEQNE